jgi:hypothetical protein
MNIVPAKVRMNSRYAPKLTLMSLSLLMSLKIFRNLRKGDRSGVVAKMETIEKAVAAEAITDIEASELAPKLSRDSIVLAFGASLIWICTLGSSLVNTSDGIPVNLCLRITSLVGLTLSQCCPSFVT